MTVQENDTISGLRKASMLLLALGTNASAQVLKHLNESEIERLSSEIVRMRSVDPETTQAVIEEFKRLSETDSGMAGREFAVQVLEQVVGPEKTKQLVQRAAGSDGIRPFVFLWDTDTSMIARMLEQEHPQIISLVLVNLPREKAADVLSDFSDDLQGRIARTICNMEDVDTDVIKAIEEVLQDKLVSSSQHVNIPAGPRALAEILSSSERSTERIVLEALSRDDPSRSTEVRGMLFVFEDIIRLEGRGIQLVLREVEQDDLRLSVKGADEVIKEAVFKNMSERAAEALKEELEIMGSTKVKEVEAAQQRVAAVARRLLATGAVALADSGEEQVT